MPETPVVKAGTQGAQSCAAVAWGDCVEARVCGVWATGPQSAGPHAVVPVDEPWALG